MKTTYKERKREFQSRIFILSKSELEGLRRTKQIVGWDIEISKKYPCDAGFQCWIEAGHIIEIHINNLPYSELETLRYFPI